jgi:thermostable 8-oxoguanine DNA glycosylase
MDAKKKAIELISKHREEMRKFDYYMTEEKVNFTICVMAAKISAETAIEELTNAEEKCIESGFCCTNISLKTKEMRDVLFELNEVLFY